MVICLLSSSNVKPDGIKSEKSYSISPLLRDQIWIPRVSQLVIQRDSSTQCWCMQQYVAIQLQQQPLEKQTQEC